MSSVILFKVPCFTLVLFVFGVACEQLKVLCPVVSDIVVYVMDYLGAGKSAPQVLSHNEPVFHNVSVFTSHADKFGWTSNVLDAGRVFSFSTAVRDASFPCRITRPAQGSLLPSLRAGWIGVKLWLSFTKHTLGFPYPVTGFGAEFMFSPVPCFRHVKRFIAGMANCVIRTFDRLSVALLRAKAGLMRLEFVAASLTGLMGYRIHTPIITYVL
jgi:hypothetical protein